MLYLKGVIRMKNICSLLSIVAILGFLASVSLAYVEVDGYVTSRGTYVNSYVRSAPDRELGNNFSTYGNINPYSGKIGTEKHRDSR